LPGKGKEKEEPMRYLVLSDMHFGEKDSSAGKRPLLEALAAYLKGLGPTTVVFSGDTLDLNLSTFTRSIEGEGEQVGFREFLALLARVRVEVPRWVYLPGNHDYRIWDVLATQQVCLDVLAAGESLRDVPHPLRAGRWGGKAFLAGVFPVAWRDNLIIEYPEHVVSTPAGELVITHGHYFDPKQTLKNTLEELITEEGLEPAAAVRQLFIETAAYQTLAGCASFTPWTRKWVNRLVGPGSWAAELGALARRAAAWFGAERKDLLVSPLRGEQIDAGQLSAAEFYLKYFAGHAAAPRYLVYGHTHRQDHASTGSLPAEERIYPEAIEVYNAGGFYPEGGTVASFLSIDIPRAGDPVFTPLYMDAEGRVQERRLEP